MATKYDINVLPNLERIEWWLRKGAGLEEVALKLGIHRQTLQKYIEKGKAGIEPYVALFNTFSRGRTSANEELEAALFKSAKGYQWEEVTTETVYDPAGNVMGIKEKRRLVDVPPNPSSIQFWLANCDKEHYQYKPQPKVEAEGTETGVVLLPAVEDPEDG